MASMYSYERELWDNGNHFIAGVDEVGRGAWAGPLVAAAVILPRKINGLRDSKVLKAPDRHKLYERILNNCAVGVGITEIVEINMHGLTWANQVAMKRAIESLNETPHHLLIDYIKLPRAITQLPQTAIIDGDALSASIAAASIIAKVTRDSLMAQLHKSDAAVSDFAFNKNFGYGTKTHMDALSKHGPTKYHRQFYAPVVQSRQTALDI